jgi:hypothetical protein
MSTDLDFSVSDGFRVGAAMPDEFQTADLGDKRLTDRLQDIAARLGRAPRKSIPAACTSWAETKATYRFCDNETVDPTNVQAAHVDAHIERISDLDELLVISDTTHLTYPSHPSKEGLGDIGTSSIDVEGVKLHTTIGIDPASQVMTGLLDQQVLVEDQSTGETYETNGRREAESLETQQAKWLRGDREAIEALPTDVRPVFVHDRGADGFSFHHWIASESSTVGYVIRANQNRCIRTAAGDEKRLFDWSETLSEREQTTIELQQGGNRSRREAELSISAGTCELCPPKNDSTFQEPVEVNVVRVDEVGNHDDPIRWILLTSEPVETVDEITTVIEYYRSRWKIEDWHKVLKSGCRIEDRQLETWERMEVLLSIYSVVAWKVLELRELARGSHGLQPAQFLSEAEQAVLEAKYPELADRSGTAYAIAVAKVGGYLDRGADPPPGWETMWKGLQEIRLLAKGYELGAS